MADRKAIVLGSAGNQELFQSTDKLVLDGATLFKSDVHIDGSLVVNGTSTTLDTVTLTVDDVNIELGAVNEVHNIAVTPENLAYTLSDGTNSVTTSALGASPTIATLVTAIAAASGYSSLEFTVSANSNSDGIHLTYKTIGPKAEVATLTKDGGSPITATVIINVSDTTSDGGGLSLYGTTIKTFNWSNSTGSWTSSENIDLASGKDFKINGTSVLTHNALGSGVTSSSLTAVGTITTGTWNGTAIGQAYGGTGHSSFSNGQLLIGKADGTLAKAFLTQGTNTVITNGDGSIEIVAKDTTYTISAEQTGGSDADPDIKITAGGNGSTVASTVALVGGGGTTVTRNSASQITISSAGDQSISATQTGDRVDIALSNNGGYVTLTGGTATTITRTSASEITIAGQDTTYTNATSSAAGLMSPTDKTRLDTLHAGSNVNYLQASSNDDFTGRLSHNNPGGVALYVRGENSDTTVYRVTSQTASGATTDTSGMYGFSMVYTGTGAGNNNSLDLYSDNQNAQSQTHVYSVTQDGVLDFKVAPTISGNGLLTSATTFGGDVSGTSNALVVADNSHNHTIANVTSLATTLADKIGISGGTINGLFAVKRYYANRDDTAAEFGYFTSSANTTARTAGFITAKGALYLGNNGDTTTSNFKTKLAEDGSATFAGNLGIGTESPLTGANLTVAGTGLAITGQNTAHSANSIRIGEEGSGAAQIRCYGPDATTNGSLNFRVSRSDGSNSKDVIIDSSGRVGIGASNNSSYDSIAQNLLVADESGNTGITIRSGGSTPFGAIHFADGTGSNDEKRAGRIIYQHHINTLSFNTANAEAMRIDSSGKVGIGCTPVRDLQLHTADTSSELMLSNSTTGATAGSGFMIQQDGNDNYIWNKENSFMSFGTNATERMKITSEGEMYLLGGSSSGSLHFWEGCNVTGNSDTGRLGHGKNGNTLIYTNASTPARNVFAIGTSSSVPFVISTNNAERMRIDSSGNVGINASTIDARLTIGAESGVPTLHLSGSPNVGDTTDIALSANAVIRGENSIRNVINDNGYFSWSVGGTDNLAGTSGSTERMRIDSSGRLLVGGTASSLTLTGGVESQNAGVVGTSATLDLQSGVPGFMSRLSGNNNADQVVGVWFNHGGLNAGIGCSRKVTNQWGTDLRFYTHKSQVADQHEVYERMRIDSEGNVGIGTSAPSHPLEVRGVNTQINFAATSTGGGYLMSTGAGQWSISGGVRYNGAGWYARHTSSSMIRDDGDANLRFFTNTGTTVNTYIAPSERMRITSSGSLLVGTTSASTNGLLTVECDTNQDGIVLKAQNAGGQGSQPGIVFEGPTGTELVNIYADNTASELRINTASTERMRIDSSGLVSTVGNLEVGGGVLDLKNTGSQSELRLYCESSNAHYLALKAPPHSAFSGNVTFTLPGADGTADQVLKTDGSGNLGWVTASSGGGGGAAASTFTGTDDTIQTHTSSSSSSTPVNNYSDSSGDLMAYSNVGSASSGQYLDLDFGMMGYDSSFDHVSTLAMGAGTTITITDNNNNTFIFTSVSYNGVVAYEYSSGSWIRMYVSGTVGGTGGGASSWSDLYFTTFYVTITTTAVAVTITGSNNPAWDTTKDVTIDGVIYPSGTWTVNGSTATATFGNDPALAVGDAIYSQSEALVLGESKTNSPYISNISFTGINPVLNDELQINVLPKLGDGTGAGTAIVVPRRFGTNYTLGQLGIAETSIHNTIYAPSGNYSIDPGSNFGCNTSNGNYHHNANVVIGFGAGSLRGHSGGTGQDRISVSGSVIIGFGAGEHILGQHFGTVIIGAHCASDRNQYTNHSNTTGIGTGCVGIGTDVYKQGGYGDFPRWCVAIGYGAGAHVGGDYNTAIGYQALYNTPYNSSIQSTGYRGHRNTCIGYRAKPSSSTVNDEITLGNSQVATLRCNVTSISSLSDGRDKKDVEDIDVGLEFIKAVRPVKFEWDRRERLQDHDEDGEPIGEEIQPFAGVKEYGFIAQELDAVVEQYGNEEYAHLVHHEDEDRLEAEPFRLFPILLKAVQELSEKCDDLEARNRALESRIAALEPT